MSFMELGRHGKDLKEIEREIQKGTERMRARKNMNGYDWENRKKLVQERNELQKKVVDVFKHL